VFQLFLASQNCALMHLEFHLRGCGHGWRDGSKELLSICKHLDDTDSLEVQRCKNWVSADDAFILTEQRAFTRNAGIALKSAFIPSTLKSGRYERAFTAAL
jgi:hypothetical protein